MVISADFWDEFKSCVVPVLFENGDEAVEFLSEAEQTGVTFSELLRKMAICSECPFALIWKGDHIAIGFNISYYINEYSCAIWFSQLSQTNDSVEDISLDEFMSLIMVGSVLNDKG